MTVIRHPERAEEAARLVAEHGSVTAAARATGINHRTMADRYRQARKMGLAGVVGKHKGKQEAADAADPAEPIVRGRVHATPRTEWDVPSKGKVVRYIFTCAQSNTHLHDACWMNLQALARHYGARVCVSTFTYDLASYGAQSIKRGTAKAASTEPWYDTRVEQHILDEPIVVAPGLVWCGEMNILPTAARPLSGFEAYTGRKSGIFPHVKFAMESIASGKSEGTKLNYTTGTVTQRNYIAKKAGQKAEFHHGYGALLVEVDSDGTWFCRQLNADSEGTVYDLDLRAYAGRVTAGHRMEGITWGDIHEDTLPDFVRRMLWGNGGMVDVLRPRHQFMHDVLNFRRRNHHDVKNPHKMFEKYVNGEETVIDEVKSMCEFLAAGSYRPWCKTVVVDSNHDNAFDRWLREGDYKTDLPNAIFFLDAQLHRYKAIRDKNKNFHLLEWAFRNLAGDLYPSADEVLFLRPDESFILCPDANGGIECGMHGDRGPNGMRGSLRQFARMGRKSNTGHGHAAGIDDGAYRSGITGDLDQGYNAGPSSWSRSHIATYANGKRAILTSYGEKWRADA